MTELIDSFHRPINYLRISITDRCNLRCVYCMPEEGVHSISHSEVLRYEEILTIVRAAALTGITKLRITGGEPLVRLGIVDLIRMLSGVEGIDDIALTTNGVLLGKYAQSLKDAGLRRVNISMDTLRSERFAQITRCDQFDKAMEGIAAAKDAGLEPVKINMVVIRGVNDDEVPDFARKTIDEGWNVRFIEPMPFMSDTQISFVSVSEITERIGALGTLEPCFSSRGNGPAKYYKFDGSSGTLGFIGPLSQCFCSNCNRLRLTVDGMLRPCLMSEDELDLKTPLRNGASLEEIKELIIAAARMKPEKHRLNEAIFSKGREMCQMGG